MFLNDLIEICKHCRYSPQARQPELMQGVPGSQGVPSAHHPPASFNPFIYGNDVDSVDIATRVAMVYLSINYLPVHIIILYLESIIQDLLNIVKHEQ